MIQTNMVPEIMLLRSELLQAIRSYFYEKDFLEVDTPLLSKNIIPEVTIELFSTKIITPYDTGPDLYLLPSPEYWHKKLIAEQPGKNFFQMSKAFRNSEQISPIHNIEFTILEWYCLNADYKYSMGFTKELIQLLANRFLGEFLSFSTITVAEACKRYGGFDLDTCSDLHTLRNEAAHRGHTVPEDESWPDTFNRIFISDVEPKLPTDMPLFLIDYPAKIPCLAKDATNHLYKERWELYWKGMELANCYTEETDAAKIKEYMETEGYEKDRVALVPAKRDASYWKQFEKDYPDVSGVALGVDRLLMALTDSKDISEVIYFPFKNETT